MQEVFEKALEAWIASRPECVRQLAARFPPGDRIEGPSGTIYYIIGYTEDDMLIVSPVKPWEDYDAALANKHYICAKHLEG